MTQAYVLMQPGAQSQADEWVRLGLTAHVAGTMPDAERHYLSALRLDPGDMVATQNLACVYAQTGRLLDALQAIERATMLTPVHHIPWSNWALMALDADRYDEALDAAAQGAKVLACDETRTALAMVLTARGRAADAVPLYDQVTIADLANPAHMMAGYNGCFTRTLTDATPADALAARARVYALQQYTGPRAPHGNDRTPDRVLRVGYVSGDFKRHSAAFIFGAVVRHHDPSRVQTYLYSTLPVDPGADEVTASFQKAGVWRDLCPLTDEQADALIRQDGIDVLVDLSGHTGGNRLPLFSRKPAPVQVTAWGFAHGTGIPEIDYFLADPIAVPGTEREHYAERVWDLPCIVGYDPPAEYALKGTSPAPFTRDENGYITLGVFSRFEKLSDAALGAWAEILRRVPDARLLLKDRAFRRPFSIRRVRDAMPGIDPGRLTFAIDSHHNEHMAAYQHVDLILDPFPHTGGCGALEQLYMGVPIVTRYGVNPGGRTTASVLTVLGRGGGVAQSVEDYIALAVSLATERTEIAAARKTLRPGLLDSPLCNGTYVTAVEDAYRAMWGRWCQP